ncbi:hypothetical protein HR057_13595 [Bacillus sp. P2(2020)]|uniref:Lipoprotein n=2 Tax=Calidifontibacillus erzurumensis TaxID=2741433 RepID=A0A8J8GF51_9BACI|nr:hypothetical protein [Calidifontibacillus erzurumensis]
MMKKTSVFGLVFLLLVSGCTSEANDKAHLDKLNKQIQEQAQVIDRLKQENEELAKKAAEWQTINDKKVLSAALAIVEALKAKDMDRLAMYAHPDKGVRFSPYGHVDPSSDIVFAKDELPSLMESSRMYQFGTFDGSGEPIMMTFGDYFQKFVYDVDFANPHMIGNNIVIGKGNTLENIHEVYPNGVFVEFHFTGFDKQYNGMDWKSLRLVFEQDGDIWRLVGIVHDQWTI